MTRIQDMRNLGPKMALWLAAVDIHTAEDLRTLGSVGAYRRLKFRFGKEITLNALYAMEAALRDCDWRALSPETKQALLDQLAQNQPSPPQ